MKRNQTSLGLEETRPRGQCDGRGWKQVVSTGPASSPVGQGQGLWCWDPRADPPRCRVSAELGPRSGQTLALMSSCIILELGNVEAF